MGTEIGGAELTDTYAELLTIEARLAEEANEWADRALDEFAVIPAPRMDYRRVVVITGDDEEDLVDLARRLWVERPAWRVADRRP